MVERKPSRYHADLVIPEGETRQEYFERLFETVSDDLVIVPPPKNGFRLTEDDIIPALKDTPSKNS